MICGEFEESIKKTIRLENVKEKHFKSLLYLACGSDEEKVVGVEELFMLGELADSLEMKDVVDVVEDMLLRELTAESCLEMLRCSAVSGLERVREACRATLIGGFQEVSETDGFLELSEETLSEILEEDDLGVPREEEIHKAVMRWIMANGRQQFQGCALLTKIRYGLMDDNYLEGIATMATPAHGALKELVEDALTRKGTQKLDAVWNGVNCLCDKLMAARKVSVPFLNLAAGTILGSGVLREPCDVAVDREGRIWVCDAALHQIIMFHRDGLVTHRLGLQGAAEGQFGHPRSVAVDVQGRVVVADCYNHRINVLNLDGSVACCFGSEGAAVGQLDGPCSVAVDREGRYIVVDSDNHRIQVFNADGSVTCHFGSKGSDIGQLDCPLDVAVDGTDRIVVADGNNYRVQVFNGDGSVALCFGSRGDGPGQFRELGGVAVNKKGQFIVADYGNHRIQIFNADGSFARSIGKEGTGVGQLKYPNGLAVDGAGRILVAETGDDVIQWSGRVQVF